ncbi:MAG: UDP-2,3-diacylglucosamine hydrolase [Candidatus Endobugula sp.]|jgi:UDP-2,3-diacylglucosamine hydrolase
MSLLFISDLHLDPKRPAITQAFYAFLDTTAKDIEALYILGDFFETWLGDDDDTPLYLEVITQLKNYTDSGTAVYFMHGNRDFLIGEHFAQQAGVSLIKDPSLIDYQGQQYLLLHGDSLCTKDNEYMQFRAKVRSPQWQQEVLSKTLEQRRNYAKELRQQSQAMTSLKAEDIVDVSSEAVIDIMRQYNVNSLIHGHTHRPNTHPLTIDNKSAQRTVLGDWGELGWYIQLTKDTLSLKSFNIPS